MGNLCGPLKGFILWYTETITYGFGFFYLGWKLCLKETLFVVFFRIESKKTDHPKSKDVGRLGLMAGRITQTSVRDRQDYPKTDIGSGWFRFGPGFGWSMHTFIVHFFRGVGLNFASKHEYELSIHIYISVCLQLSTSRCSARLK